MLPKRLERLPSHDIGGGLVVHEARGFRARLLGLAFLPAPPAGHALLIPRCASVHTFGMRFPIDVAFVDAELEVVAVEEAVPPRRLAAVAGAHAVLETPAHAAAYFSARLRRIASSSSASARSFVRADARFIAIRSSIEATRTSYSPRSNRSARRRNTL